jgi:hypothetical protein
MSSNNLSSIKVALYYYLIFIVSFLYAYTLISIPMDGIPDRDNYLNYALNASEIWTRYTQISIFVNEPIWLEINEALSHLFYSPKITVLTIIFFASFVTAFVVLKVNKKYFIYLLAIILLWQVMQKNIIHLRQGLAISFFLVAYFLENKKIKFFLYTILPFIHLSFFFILFILIFSHYIKRINIPIYINYILQVLLYIFISLFILYLAQLLGARQANGYIETSQNISGLGFIFWSIILLLYITEHNKFQTTHYFSISILFFYLSAYFLLPVSARIFESAIILVLLSALDLSDKRKYIFFALFSIYFILQSNQLIIQFTNNL